MNNLDIGVASEYSLFESVCCDDGDIERPFLGARCRRHPGLVVQETKYFRLLFRRCSEATTDSSHWLDVILSLRSKKSTFRVSFNFQRPQAFHSTFALSNPLRCTHIAR